MRQTRHAINRVWNRLAELGLSEAQLKTLQTVAYARAKRSEVASEAVRLCKLGQAHNVPWSAESNGDEIWAIIRQRDLVTLMFRRSTQPKTPQALRVAKVSILH